MVVVTFTSSSCQKGVITDTPQFSSTTCKPPTSPFVLHIHRIHGNPRRQHKASNASNCKRVLSVRAYMEKPNSMSNFANKVIGSLPVVGLVARILSDEGGVGGDTIDFAEFRRRVGKKCSITDSRAFYDFQGRRGKPGDPLYVLLCCWLAAVGAGLLKSEEILEGVARLRISNDIEFEEENFIALMNEAKERRARSRVTTPSVPMEIRVEKALEAIYVCCFGKDAIEEEDERLLCVMLSAVFPSVKKSEVERIVKDKATRVAEGTYENKFSKTKRLPKEAVEQQMKDLQFLKQNRDP